MAGFKSWGGLVLAWMGLVGCGGVESPLEDGNLVVLGSFQSPVDFGKGPVPPRARPTRTSSTSGSER